MPRSIYSTSQKHAYCSYVNLNHLQTSLQYGTADVGDSQKFYPGSIERGVNLSCEDLCCNRDMLRTTSLSNFQHVGVTPSYFSRAANNPSCMCRVHNTHIAKATNQSVQSDQQEGISGQRLPYVRYIAGQRLLERSGIVPPSAGRFHFPFQGNTRKLNLYGTTKKWGSVKCLLPRYCLSPLVTFQTRYANRPEGCSYNRRRGDEPTVQDRPVSMGSRTDKMQKAEVEPVQVRGEGTEGTAPPSPSLSTMRPAAVIFTLSALSTVCSMNTGLVTIGIPLIASDLQISDGLILWLAGHNPKKTSSYNRKDKG
jgi:hypothetical protein